MASRNKNDSRVAVRVLERGKVKATVDLESKRQLESEMRDQDDEDEEEMPPAKRTRGNRELSGLDSSFEADNTKRTRRQATFFAPPVHERGRSHQISDDESSSEQSEEEVVETQRSSRYPRRGSDTQPSAPVSAPVSPVHSRRLRRHEVESPDEELPRRRSSRLQQSEEVEDEQVDDDDKADAEQTDRYSFRNRGSNVSYNEDAIFRRAVSSVARTPAVPASSSRAARPPPSRRSSDAGSHYNDDGSAAPVANPEDSDSSVERARRRPASSRGRGSSAGNPVALGGERGDADRLAVNLHDLGLIHPAGSMGAKRPGGPATSLSDTDPLDVDSKISWDAVGGLAAHVRALKEMVVLPLLYPDLFSRMGTQAPRGVLFHGPPGTGKTLAARALVNSCGGSNGQKVSFFMRKGADCLSKWVGEAERQLRLLFDTARQHAPAVIFFDEIDGLAPVRSSRQDQIHASVVATLLALMDGLDSRGQVIVIGATNRPDAIDPALRRPGRFDRELYFPLPAAAARQDILAIHTKSWQPAVQPVLLESLASRTAGYCGADLRALCSEAVLRAVRRTYPQIYSSEQRLCIDAAAVHVQPEDFEGALGSLTPASHRSAPVVSRPLAPHLRSLLESQFQAAKARLSAFFPLGARTKSMEVFDDVINDSSLASSVDFSAAECTAFVRRPLRARFLLAPSRSLAPELIGAVGTVCGAHLAPALLQSLEEFAVFSIDLAALFGDSSARCAEEALQRSVSEARRNAPSILYWPHADLWWRTATRSLRAALRTLLADLPPTAPVLLLATLDDSTVADSTADPNAANDVAGGTEADEIFAELFDADCTFAVNAPAESERTVFFSALQSVMLEAATSNASTHPAVLQRISAAHRVAHDGNDDEQSGDEREQGEPLPIDTAAAQRSAESIRRAEAATAADALRLLRVFLRSVCERLLRTYREFVDPVDLVRVPVYAQVVAQPLCLLDVQRRINASGYPTLHAFLSDIDLIVANCQAFTDAACGGQRLMNRACAMQDTVMIMCTQLDRGLVAQCAAIEEKRLASVASSTSAEAPSTHMSTALTPRTNAAAPTFAARPKSPCEQSEMAVDPAPEPEAERPTCIALERVQHIVSTQTAALIDTLVAHTSAFGVPQLEHAFAVVARLLRSRITAKPTEDELIGSLDDVRKQVEQELF